MCKHVVGMWGGGLYVEVLKVRGQMGIETA